MKLKDKISSLLEKAKKACKNPDKKQPAIICIVIAVIFILSLIIFIYIRNTEPVPAYGGTYVEGVLGSPRFLNPLYSSKSETDKDLAGIIFAGLMKYDEENELVPYLAEDIKVSDGRVFEVTLRDDIYWSDGEKITVDDVIFTVDMIQNRSVQSPLRISWEGVRAEKESERKVLFYLESPSSTFIERLTLQPIPEHAWEDVPIDDLQFSELNLDPISSGPYKLDSISERDGEISSLSLTRNPYYFGKTPYIEELVFKFFRSETHLKEQSENLDGFALSSIKNEINTDFKEYAYFLPRYFALFFNLEEFNYNTRKALRKITDKEEILGSIDKIERIDSPAIPSFYGLNNPNTNYDFDPEKAATILEEEGYYRNEDDYFEKVVREEDYFEFTETLREDDQGEEVRRLQECLIDLSDEHSDLFPDGEVTGYFDSDTKEAVNRFQDLFREEILDPHGFTSPTGMVASSTQEKLNEFCGGTIPEETEVLSITITTIDHPLLMKVTGRIIENWDRAGITAEKRIIDLQSIESEIIEDKNFQSFLFGISMEAIPDPLRWWHSEQVDDPGLNFTNYRREEVDAVLSSIRTSTEREEKKEYLEEFQDLILEDKPAIFLYSPHYLYMVDGKVNGIQQGKIVNSSERFQNINYWYINTKRAWKNN